MMLDHVARELVAVMDVAIACAAVVLAVTTAVLIVATELRLRAPRAVAFVIAVPPGQPPAPELLFTHFHSLLRPTGRLAPSQGVALAAVASSDGVRLVVSMPARLGSLLGTSLDAIWPGATLIETDAPVRAGAQQHWCPVATDDERPSVIAGAAPALVRALARTPRGESLAFTIALRRERGRSSIARGLLRSRAAPPRSHPPTHANPDTGLPVFDVSVLIAASSARPSRARTLVHEFMPHVEALCVGTGIQLERRRSFAHAGAPGTGAGLTPAQLARVFPLAALSEEVTRSSALVVNGGERLLGRRNTGRGDSDVRISLATSRHHLHVLGATGTGKSTLLLNLIVQDIESGRGCAVLDPKGDLVHDLLARIPRRRLDDVVYIGPDEGSHSVGINPLQLAPHEDPNVAAENVLSIFKRVYADSWGPRTDDVLKSCLLTLVAVPGATLAHIPVLLSDGAIRRELTAHVDDIGVGGFWRWYERVSEGKRLEIAAPLQHKLRDVLVRPRLRRLLCQARSTVELGALMDRGGILLADLGTGRWGEGASALAGSFLVARLWQAALSRQGRPEQQRVDFLVYVDEFQSFLGIGGPFAEALAQARALRLSLTLANQHLGQLPREVSAAVAANARGRILFRASAADATALAGEFVPLGEETLSTLVAFEAAVRLPDIRGAFLARMLPPAPICADAVAPAEVLGRAAARYGRPVLEVDEDLRRAVGLVEADDEPVRLPRPSGGSA